MRAGMVQASCFGPGSPALRSAPAPAAAAARNTTMAAAPQGRTSLPLSGPSSLPLPTRRWYRAGGWRGPVITMARMPLFGTPVVRREDARLLTGGAQYVSNLDIPGAAHVTYVTATMAHARIVGIDVRDAWKVPGVLDIVTADDIDIGPMGFIDKTWPAAMVRPLLATGRVLFTGQALAAIVTETREA